MTTDSRAMSKRSVLILAGAIAGCAGVGYAAVDAATPDGKASPGPVAGIHFHDCRDCPEMVAIAPGHFSMGSPTAEEQRFDTEGPQHPVDIPHGFAIGLYDVTREQYAVFAKETVRDPGDACRMWDGKGLPMTSGLNWRSPGFKQTGRDPVVCITWGDAKAYVAWLNDRVAKSQGAAASGVEPYRLPTEAEWEYAARANTTTAYYYGDHGSHEQMNFGTDVPTVFAPVVQGRDQWKFTSPSGSFPANPWGLFDMAGNVWQWTEDCWHSNYLGAPSDGSPWIDGKCESRVVRGGSWFKPLTGERSAKRGPIPPTIRNTEIGFRVARSLD